MYKSKYYTCEEIDERLLKGYYDDAVLNGYSGTFEEFKCNMAYMPQSLVVDLTDKYSLSTTDIQLSEVISKITENDRKPGFLGKYYLDNRWHIILFNSDDISLWDGTEYWSEIPSLLDNALFSGVATPGISKVNSTYPLFWIARSKGTYFDELVIEDNGLYVILLNNGSYTITKVLTIEDSLSSDSDNPISTKTVTQGLLKLTDDTKKEFEKYVPKSSLKTINGNSLLIGEDNITDINIQGCEYDNTYTPTLDGSTKITTEIGIIKAGSTLKELEGKSYSEIIEAMLVNESYNDPGYNHSISLGDINTIVKVGSNVVVPLVTATWNSSIQSNSTKVITNSLTKNILGTSETVYNISGNSTFTLTYSYPEGYYDITSNLGNTKRIIVPGKTNATISKTVTATYPWFINNTEQTLIAIGNSKTIEVELIGSPVIKIPFENSTAIIQADLGLGWMDVEWDVSMDNSNLGGAIDENVPYKVYSKPDSYASYVKHKIIINLSK